jgi:hypothetical protein
VRGSVERGSAPGRQQVRDAAQFLQVAALHLWEITWADAQVVLFPSLNS